MFYDTRSPSSTHLLDHFLDSFTKANPSDPFQKKWVIVQNKDVASFLSFQESDKIKVSANNEYIFPSELIWKLYRLKNPDVPQKLPFDLISLQWSIYHVLIQKPDLLLQVTGKSELEELVLLQLAGQIADVFDLYQVYRPEMIDSWQRGSYEGLPDHLHWQAILWNAVRKNIPQNNSLPKSRAEAFTELINWIKNDEFPFLTLPTKIWIYRLPQMSRPFVQLLNELSQHIDIYYYNDINGSEGETDLKAYHEFLTKPAIDSDHLIREIIQTKKEEVIEASSSSNSLLKSIQSICNGNKAVSNSLDNSFTIHSCHSIRREVEVLRDNILRELENNSELAAEDILVLVPNLADYASLIVPILEGSDQEVPLPVSYIHQNISEQVEEAFIQLIGLLSSKFKANDFIDFLDMEIIRAKWKLTDEHIQQLREWVIQLKIRRGFDGDVFSWREGIDRLLLGYCMLEDSYLEDYELSAFSPGNQNEAVHLLATISGILDQLSQFRDRISAKQGLSEWLNVFKDLALQLLTVPTKDDFNSQSLLKKLEDLKEYTKLSIATDKVDYFTVSTWLKGVITSSKAASTAFGNGIKIGEYVPNRRNPHKFVAILGLNESALPRKIVRPDFDLIHQKPRVGDRIQIEEDRHVFYDLIQNAEQTLYLSFIGQDLYSENKKAPSILLDQLLDITQKYSIKVPIHEHSLHGFSSQYFIGEKKSFSKLKKKISERLAISGGSSLSFIQDFTSSVELVDEVSVDELIQFYTHPSKYMCVNLLGLNFYEEFEVIENREPFNINHLDKYKIRFELVDDILNSHQHKLTITELHSRGVLPSGFPGELEYEKAVHILDLYKDVLAEYPIDQKEELDLTLNLNETKLHAKIKEIYPNARLEVLVSSLKGKHLMKAWIKHLVLNTQDNKPTVIYYIEKDELKSVLFEAVDDASIYLNELVSRYKEAIQNPDSYFVPIETAYIYSKTLNEKNIQAAIKKAETQWLGDAFSGAYNVESQDRYHALLVSDNHFYAKSDFNAIVQSIWEPLHKHLVTK